MSIIQKFMDKFNLINEKEDFNTVHTEIEQGVYFRGTNLWVLIFAIFIASIGLNVNSTAVIIGAMLISPLMGPIVGAGYSLATYDFSLFKASMRNYVFAMLAGLITSTLYFMITPINGAHSELLARTSPNIYDVLIALFGGLAGILVIGSKRKGNVVPGVAIATALMPPLCTAGYGLATGNFQFLFGALYLFVINSVFIGLATLITTRVIYRFPVASHLSDKQKRKANNWLYIIVLCTTLPSLYFGYMLVQQEKFSSAAASYIKNETNFPNEFLLKSEVDASTKTIKLIFGGKGITSSDIKRLEQSLEQYKLQDAKLIVQKGFSIQDTQKEETENQRLQNELNILKQKYGLMQLDYDSLVKNQKLGIQLNKEIKIFFPSITNCYANFTSTSDSLQPRALLFFAESQENMEEPIDPSKIKQWLQIKYPNTKVLLEISYR